MNLTTDQQVSLTVKPLSALGRPVPASAIAGVPLWNTSDASVVSLVVAADGFSAVAIGAAGGTATVTVIANAGTAGSPVQIQGTIDITVSQAPAASLSIVAGTPTTQA